MTKTEIKIWNENNLIKKYFFYGIGNKWDILKEAKKLINDYNANFESAGVSINITTTFNNGDKHYIDYVFALIKDDDNYMYWADSYYSEYNLSDIVDIDRLNNDPFNYFDLLD